MPGISDWSPYKTHVQGGLREGNFLNGQFIMIAAGPPFLSLVGLGAGDEIGEDIAYPIGLTQNIALSQNKAISRIFEIGSDRSYSSPVGALASCLSAESSIMAPLF